MVTNRIFVRAAAVFALVALVIAATPADASAQEAERRGFFGEVTSVEADAIEVLLKAGETLRLRVDVSDPDVIKRVDTSDDAAGDVALQDLFQVGSRIATLAEMRENEWWAVKLSAVRARAVEAHVTVTVIHVSGTTAITETESGDEVVIELDFEPPEDLEGQVVTFVGRRLEDRRFRATAAKTVRAIVKRLDKHVQQKQQELDREGDSSPRRQKLQELKARLERSVVEQMKRFTEVLVKLPPEARPRLENALENLKREFKAALEVVGKPPEERDQLLDHRRLDGIVDGVDVAAGVVSIRTRSDAIIGATVGDETVVKIGRDEGSLESLQDGDRVHVRFGQDGNVTTIQVITDVHVKGRIEQIDTEARTVTLALEGGVLLTLDVPEQADLHVGNDQTSFGQVEVGTVLHVTYDSRLLVLRKAVLESRAELEFEVLKVDREAGTITGRTPDGREHTIKLAGNAKLIVAGRRVGVAAIKIGNRVVIVVDKRDGSAVRVESHDDSPRDHAKRARGIPAGIDVDSGALTLELPGGGQLTVVVGDLTEVEVDGETGTLNDILSDSLVQVSYDPQTGAALTVHAKSKVEPSAFLAARPPQDDGQHDESAEGEVVGIVGAVDLIERTISVFTESRRVVKLRVFDSTNVTVGGEPVDSIASVPLAAPVKVSFGPGREAFEVHARKQAVDLATLRKEHGRKALDVKTGVVRALAIHLKRPEVEGGPIIVAVTLNQRPVGGAVVFVNGAEVGETDDHGLVTVELPTEGDVITFTATFEDRKTALRIKRATAHRPGSVVRLTVFGEKVEGEVLACVRRVLGRLPASDRDATDEERRKVTAECFDRDELREAAAGLIDLRTLNCIREVFGELPVDRDLTEDEKRKIEAECFEGRPEADDGPRVDLHTLNCVVKVVGQLPADRDLTEDEKRKVAARCFQQPGDNGGNGGSGGGIHLDARTLECIVKVLGRRTDGSDLTEEDKNKVRAECSDGPTDGAGLRIDLHTLECIVKLVGRRTDGSDLTEDEKAKVRAECLEGQEDGTTDDGAKPRFDLRTLECIVRVLGRHTDGSDLSEDEKSKARAECIEGQADGSNGNGAGLRLDLRTLECIVKVLGRQTDGKDLTEDEKRKVGHECSQDGEDGPADGTESGPTDSSESPPQPAGGTAAGTPDSGTAPDSEDTNDAPTRSAAGTPTGVSDAG